jgi:hypothetical protein
LAPSLDQDDSPRTWQGRLLQLMILLATVVLAVDRSRLFDMVPVLWTWTWS